jgi:nitrate reductase gamma subunit
VIGGAAAGDTHARGPGAGPPAALAVVLGALSVLAVPSGIAAAQLTDRVQLVAAIALSAGTGFVLGLLSVVARRLARRRLRRSVRPQDQPLRLGKWLGWLGLYLSAMGGLALAVYALLRLSE